jgi:hypothetical protein
MNPRVQYAYSLRETLLSSSDRSEGSQRALCGGESLVVRVDGYRSILDAYDAGREAELCSYYKIFSLRRRYAAKLYKYFFLNDGVFRFLVPIYLTSFVRTGRAATKVT